MISFLILFLANYHIYNIQKSDLKPGSQPLGPETQAKQHCTGAPGPNGGNEGVGPRRMEFEMHSELYRIKKRRRCPINYTDLKSVKDAQINHTDLKSDKDAQ